LISQTHICGHHAAVQITEHLPGGGSVRDSIVSLRGTILLTVTYAYPVGTSPDQAAEASIRSLCPQRSIRESTISRQRRS
jgi:hypothetical protein